MAVSDTDTGYMYDMSAPGTYYSEVRFVAVPCCALEIQIACKKCAGDFGPDSLGQRQETEAGGPKVREMS